MKVGSEFWLVIEVADVSRLYACNFYIGLDYSEPQTEPPRVEAVKGVTNDYIVLPGHGWKPDITVGYFQGRTDLLLLASSLVGDIRGRDGSFEVARIRMRALRAGESKITWHQASEAYTDELVGSNSLRKVEASYTPLHFVISAQTGFTLRIE